MRTYISIRICIKILKDAGIEASESDTGMYIHIPDHFVSISSIKQIELLSNWVDIHAFGASYTIFFSGMTHTTIFTERE